MASNTIQRQSIVSTLIIFIGFGFGAINLIVLQPHILTTEQWGLTRVVTEIAVLMASFSVLGTNTVVAKFLPFYKKHLEPHKIDLPAVTGSIFIVGMVLTMLLVYLAKPYLVLNYGKKSALFEPYFYTLYLFILFQGFFLYLEIYAWFAGNTILSNFLKELVFRFITTIILIAYAFQLINFDWFMLLFGFSYLPAVITLIITLRRKKALPIVFQLSKVTRRMGKKMVSLGSFVFLTTLSSIAFVVCDTLFLAGLYSFSQAGIYAIAQYFSQVLEVPMRSMQTSSVPKISEYWRDKNMSGLQSIYRKSSINLLVSAIGLGGLILVNIHNITRYFPPEYAIISMPLTVLIFSRWINLGTGLNAVIIQISTYWRFDFASTLIYSLVGIPLNYLLIRNYGMLGAAWANVIAMVLYNGIRFVFLYVKFGLQPFSFKNLWVIIGGLSLIGIIHFIPELPNIYIDGLIRTILFGALFVILVVKFKLSEEITALYKKGLGKLKTGR